MKNYNVDVKESVGTCNSSLFKKMAENGDLTSIKISEILNSVVSITGYSICTITTDDKSFDINYFDTKEYGLISSGSEIFRDSVLAYYGEVSQVRIVEVKTKKGKTYKAVPMLKANEETNETEDSDNDLPF